MYLILFIILFPEFKVLFIFYPFFRYAEADENDDVTGTDGAEYATMEPEGVGGGMAPLGEVGDYASLQGAAAQYASADALQHAIEPYFHGVRTPNIVPLCQYSPLPPSPHTQVTS